MLAVALTVGCTQKMQEAPVTGPSSDEETVVAVEDSAPASVELVPVLRKARPATQAKPKTVNESKAPKEAGATGTAAPLKGTISVETDGAQGRVWGHVTMNGDRGTGTIHDWDENTWAVNVTRHGDELFAVDQNSRQYVFKVK